MKVKLLPTQILAVILATLSYQNVTAQHSAVITDTVIMGPGYANEVYYSMTNGVQGTVNRKLWDIAFRTSIMSASIITNDGASVVLYTYPKSDTSGWAMVDTSGIKNWKSLVNSHTDWENGAFNRNDRGHPDYGWGVYNSVTHNLTGDSLYVIKTRNGSFYKLWIMEKLSSLNKYTIRYAKLDGQGDTSLTVACGAYSSRNFIGFSLQDGQIVDFEPVNSNSWDLLFTRYMYTYPDGITTYLVTGVLSNYKLKVNRFQPVALDFMNFDVTTMDSSRSSVGWDWKYLDDQFVYHPVDSLVFFIKNPDNNIYKLVFKEFAGMGTGRIVFDKQMISASGMNEVTISHLSAAIYPNPVKETMNLVFDPESIGRVKLVITDMAGRNMLNAHYDVQTHTLNTLSIPAENLPNGMYLINLVAGNKSFKGKVIVNR